MRAGRRCPRAPPCSFSQAAGGASAHDASPHVWKAVALSHAAALPPPGPHSARLSEVAPAFAGGISKSIVVSAAKEWLSQSVSVPSAGSPARPTDLAVEGLSRATLVLRETDVPASGCVRIADCHECIVYVLAPMAFASVINCADVTLVLGAVGRIMRLESCERCTIMAAARLLHLRNCHDCSLFVAVNMPPVLLGENRSHAAPYNTYYERLSLHLQTAGVSLAPNCWEHTVSLAAPGAASGGLPGASDLGGRGRQGLAPLAPEKCA